MAEQGHESKASGDIPTPQRVLWAGLPAGEAGYKPGRPHAPGGPWGRRGWGGAGY